jgi:hypothetical protein
MLNAILPCANMQNAAQLSVVMLNVTLLIVVIPNVVAP